MSFLVSKELVEFHKIRQEFNDTLLKLDKWHMGTYHGKLWEGIKTLLETPNDEIGITDYQEKILQEAADILESLDI
jgi:hypothetical protein